MRLKCFIYLILDCISLYFFHVLLKTRTGLLVNDVWYISCISKSQPLLKLFWCTYIGMMCSCLWLLRVEVMDNWKLNNFDLSVCCKEMLSHIHRDILGGYFTTFSGRSSVWLVLFAYFLLSIISMTHCVFSPRGGLNLDNCCLLTSRNYRSTE